MNLLADVPKIMNTVTILRSPAEADANGLHQRKNRESSRNVKDEPLPGCLEDKDGH